MLSDSQRPIRPAGRRRGRPGGGARTRGGAADAAELPLSYGQEQLWFLDRFAPGLPTYNIPQALRLSGPLDAAALGRALDGLVARHEALRTRLATSADRHPLQVIDPAGPVHGQLAELSGTGPDERLTALKGHIDAAAIRPFQLALGPLLRAHLIRLSAGDHVLLIVVHHAVFDGWSAGVFLRELAALYEQEVT